jgi:hypothetical protein
MARVGRNTQAVFGFSEGAGRLSAMLDDQTDMPFLVAREPDATPGFAVRNGDALAIRHDLGFAAVTITSEHGVVTRPVADHLPDDGYRSIGVRIDRRFGAVSLSGGVGLLREDASVLGGRFGAALGGGGANTKIVDIRVGWEIGGGWSLTGAVRQGWTHADKRGALVSGRLSSNAFAFDLAKVGHDYRFGLRIAQPMRVESGGYDLALPSGYDYASGTVAYDRQYLGLAPKGREIDVEAAYGSRLAGGWMDANLFLRRDPGNVATAPADHGMAVRYSLAF